MEVTRRLLILFGMTKEPETCGLEPVMVMLFPLVMYDNSAYREVEKKEKKKEQASCGVSGNGKEKRKDCFYITPQS